MIKTLHKIADIECKASSKDSLPNKELFDGITDSCYGDIRSAINILQFACLKGLIEIDVYSTSYV